MVIIIGKKNHTSVMICIAEPRNVTQWLECRPYKSVVSGSTPLISIKSRICELASGVSTKHLVRNGLGVRVPHTACGLWGADINVKSRLQC